jgi:hypothetical protein
MKAAGSEEFRQALSPTIGAVRDLADAVSERAGQCGHHPSASSRAMEEIAAEATFAARSGGWSEPIRDTHTFGDMTLTAAADFARSFAVLIDADSTPVYGHLVVARSVLDACVVAAWLNDPKADVTERVKRGLYEQLYSSMELVRLRLEENGPPDPDAERGRAPRPLESVRGSSRLDGQGVQQQAGHRRHEPAVGPVGHRRASRRRRRSPHRSAVAPRAPIAEMLGFVGRR